MNDQPPLRVTRLRVLFRAAVPQAFREKIVYPAQALLRKLFQSLSDRSEPARLRLASLFSGLHLSSRSRSSGAVGRISPEWEIRIADVCASPDNIHIPRHPKAGNLEGSTITMHNGLKVHALSYYGEGILNMLIANRGVHEPQEERAFMDILPHMPKGAVILELGAYWGFYSMWFASSVPEARCFLVEPDPRNLTAGKANFRLNGLTGHFTCAAVGNPKSTGLKAVRMTDVPSFCANHGIKHLNLLHSDIQGAEIDMLEGARKMLAERRIGYLFISTHGQHNHDGCLALLRAEGYMILCSVDMEETCSIDGIIVAKSPLADGPDQLSASGKSRVSG